MDAETAKNATIRQIIISILQQPGFHNNMTFNFNNRVGEIPDEHLDTVLEVVKEQYAKFVQRRSETTVILSQCLYKN